MQFTGNQMRNELKFVTEALRITERFIKESDPTMAVGKAIEALNIRLSNLSQLYKNEASDRNQMIAEAKSILNEISSIANECAGILGADGPEDNNRSA